MSVTAPRVPVEMKATEKEKYKGESGKIRTRKDGDVMLGSVHGWKGKVLEENKAQRAETQI